MHTDKRNGDEMTFIKKDIVPGIIMIGLFLVFFMFFKHVGNGPDTEVVPVDCVQLEKWIIIADGKEPHRAFKCGYIRQRVVK